MRNSRLVGGRCHSLPDPYGCDSDVRARLYKQIAGYCVISGWRRSTWNYFDLPHGRLSGSKFEMLPLSVATSQRLDDRPKLRHQTI